MVIPALRNRMLIIPAALYLIASLVCTQLPLLNYLGYEFSFVIALLATFIVGFYTIRSVKQLEPLTSNLEPTAQNSEPHTPIHKPALITFKHSLVQNILLLVIPLVVILTNAIFVKNCSLLEGMGFFVLIPVVTVIFSSSLGFFCAAHYKHSRTIFVIVVLATFAEVLAVGYYTPAVFSYNFFFGHFPGLTYDEALGIGLPLVLFRIFTLIVAAALVWLATLIVNNANPKDSTWEKGTTLLGLMVQGKNVFVTIVLAVIVGLTWWFRGELGFDSTARFIQQRLGEKFETEHFAICYAKESYEADEIEWVAAEHEFRLKQIGDAFLLPYKGKIDSYIYPSSEAKQRLMGAGNTNIAKPWNGEIHITKQSLDATLKHELVHVVAAPFGLPVFNASLSTGLVEGLAEAIDWSWGNRTLHQYAAAMHKFGAAPDINSLMLFTGFASQSSAVSYALAGSFCRYLIDTYGMRNMVLLYRSNDYEEIYRKPLARLIGDWREFLGTIPLNDSDRDAIDVLFRRPPIFKKVCARVVASRNAEARKNLASKSYARAAALFEESYHESGGYDSFGGYLTASLRWGKYDVLTRALDSVMMNDARPAQYLPLFLGVGDAFWAQGNKTRAAELYQRVNSAELSEGFAEAARLRIHALRDTMQHWDMYFLSDVSDSSRLATLESIVKHSSDNWIAKYLLARVSIRLTRFDEALKLLDAFRLDTIDSTLESQRLMMKGYGLFKLRRWEEAKIAYWSSLNFISSEATKNEIFNNVDRCEWMKNYKRSGGS